MHIWRSLRQGERRRAEGHAIASIKVQYHSEYFGELINYLVFPIQLLGCCLPCSGQLGKALRKESNSKVTAQTHTHAFGLGSASGKASMVYVR